MGRELLLSKEYIKLEVLTEVMIDVNKVDNNILGFIHGYILSAIAKYNLYGYSEAIASIEMAFSYAEDDGIIQPFIEYTRDLLDIIELYRTRHIEVEFIITLWEKMKKYKCKMQDFYGVDKVKQLTSREFEVLRLLIDGKNNRDIASELFLAEITVKKHVSSIYRKLGVKGRSHAVKKCMELKIIIEVSEKFI